VSQEKIQAVLRRRRTYRVSGDMKQCATWLFAAGSLGLSIPRFLARAGDVYARHLAMAQLRREDKAERGWNKYFKSPR
jgi:hypothetical protein